MELLGYMAAAVALGVGAIFLVSGELSFISGFSKSGRYILAFFLSFGVLGLSVKTVALFLLQNNPVLDRAVILGREIADNKPAQDVAARGLVYDNRGRHWRTLPPLSVQDNPLMVQLGQRLFFDRRLSRNQTVSCASCHDISKGGDDARSVSVGVDGLHGRRNAPSVINAAYMKKLFWDGRAKSLEDQAGGPLTNPVEMAIANKEKVVEIVQADANYRDLYQQVFGTNNLEFDLIARAIAAFERTLISNDAPYDHFVRGDKNALNMQQMKGMMLFDQLGCRNCHMDPLFSVAGIDQKSPYRPFPLFKGSPYVSKHKLEEDKGRNKKGVWRVPSLRNVEHTAPYFHNGSVNTLEEAVRVMATAQLGLKIEDKKEDGLTVLYEKDGPVLLARRKSLNEDEISQIVSFLKSLSGTPLNISNPWSRKIEAASAM